MPENTRVGLIRCDTHGAYYAALMDKHDPLRLRFPVPIHQPIPYAWLRGGIHLYFYTQYRDPTAVTVETVDGFEVVKLWDTHRDAAEALRQVLLGRPKLCDSFEEVSDGVDLVFIANANGEGHDHLELAAPGLKKGVATFIDKPLAYTLAEAQAICQLAETHGALVTSISILRTLPAADRFVLRLPEVGPVQLGAIQGGGSTLAGHVHSISLALHIFGTGVRSVRAMGETPLAIFHLDYGDQPDRPRRGVTICSDVGATFHCAYYVSAFGPKGAIQSPPLSDYDFPFGASEILKIVRTMVRTRQTPPITRDMLEAIAIAEAARTAQQTGQAVPVETTR